MCQTTYIKSPTCHHAWLELNTPCAEGNNLLTCASFAHNSPHGPARMPSHGRWAAEGECPRCDYETYDMRKRRVMEIRRTGVRVGTGPGKEDAGVDCFGCEVM